MNKDSKWFNWMVTILCIMIVVCAILGIRSTTDVVKPRVTVIISDSSNERWESLKLGLKQAAQDENVELNILSTEYFDTLEEEEDVIRNNLSTSNGFVVEWVQSQGISDILHDIIYAGPVVQINTPLDVREEAYGIQILPQNTQIGKSLASEVLLNCKEDIRGKKTGILTGNTKSLMYKERTEAFKAVMESYGAVIQSEEASFDQMQLEGLDILAVMDPLGMEDVISQNLPSSLKVYGVGGSISDLYAVDKGYVQSLVVVDEYYTGYEAILNLSRKMHNRFYSMQGSVSPYYVVNQNNLYSTDNQKLLFLDRG